MMPPLPLPDPARPVLLAGPTAGGKSALALDLACRQGRAVVNADALQVHAAWRVLTARPGPADEGAAPHLLYGHVPTGAPHSVGHWLREVAPLLAQRPAPVIVGGTGLFFSALTGGLAAIPPVPAAVRDAADRLLAEGGLAALVAGLDAATAARIDLRNPARVQRAWEVRAATGRGLADWQAETGPPLLPPAAAERWLLDPGAALAGRIADRFDAMLAGGALDEVAAALPLWPAAPPLPPWTRAIGAAELVAHLRGQMSLPDARAAAISATRAYAKRQRTWFRNRFADWRRLSPG
jgi:tRNA dimethylallyltransferase